MSRTHSSMIELSPIAAVPVSSERLVSYDLEAAPFAWPIGGGRQVADGWAYNGQVPGPVLEARAGDTVVVRVTNRLPEATTVHWHGLRVPAAMDGTDDIQRPIAPGETFEYRFVAPDPGTFWYHPHVNETVQLERGLYGMLIVRGTHEPVLDRERVVVIDDVTLDADDRIAPAAGLRERHDGREGSLRLVNGTVHPVLEVAAGSLERWRVLNASSAGYVRLSIGGRVFHVLGTDGGTIERPFPANDILLAPGDRFDLAVGPFGEGESLPLEALPYDRGLGTTGQTHVLATVRAGAGRSGAVHATASLPRELRPIEPLVRGEGAPTRTVRLSGRPGLRPDADFLVNGESHHVADPVRVGELQVWDIVNESALDHPFHLHGFFFQVLAVNGAAPPFLSWEDTVNIPANGTVRIAWIADDRPGPWMYHCHILEHHAAGMMAHFQVLRPGEAPAPHGAHVHAHAHDHQHGG